MTYFDCVRVKNNEVHGADPMDQVDTEVAYRVPKDAERAMLLVMNPSESLITIKGADNVLGGKDLKITCPSGYYALYVDINTMIQHSGEHEGCIVIEHTGENFLSQLYVFEN